MWHLDFESGRAPERLKCLLVINLHGALTVLDQVQLFEDAEEHFLRVELTEEYIDVREVDLIALQPL